MGFVLKNSRVAQWAIKTSLSAAVVMAFAGTVGIVDAQDVDKAEPAAEPVTETTKQDGAAVATAEPAAATTTVAEPDDSSRSARRRDRRAQPKAGVPEMAALPYLDASGSEVKCRSIKVTGTRLPKRVCASQATWDDVNARGEEGARDLRQRLNDAAAISPPPPDISGAF
jgi:hypothetical protein